MRENFQQRALACTITPYKANSLPVRNFKANVFERPHNINRRFSLDLLALTFAKRIKQSSKQRVRQKVAIALTAYQIALADVFEFYCYVVHNLYEVCK